MKAVIKVKVFFAKIASCSDSHYGIYMFCILYLYFIVLNLYVMYMCENMHLMKTLILAENLAKHFFPANNKY